MVPTPPRRVLLYLLLFLARHDPLDNFSGALDQTPPPCVVIENLPTSNKICFSVSPRSCGDSVQQNCDAYNPEATETRVSSPTAKKWWQ